MHRNASTDDDREKDLRYLDEHGLFSKVIPDMALSRVVSWFAIFLNVAENNTDLHQTSDSRKGKCGRSYQSLIPASCSRESTGRSIIFSVLGAHD